MELPSLIETPKPQPTPPTYRCHLKEGFPFCNDMEEELNKAVHYPDHYRHLPNGVECIDVTEHFDFLVGNAIKYLWRAGKKDSSKEVEDLEKAMWYIRRKISLLRDKEKGFL